MFVLLLMVLVTVAARDICQSELKPHLKSLVEFTVQDKKKLNLNEFKIVLKEGENFNHIFTPECDPKKFPKIFAEFREEGMEDWYEAYIYGISNHKRGKASLYMNKKEGKIRLKDIKGNDKIRELDYCKTYEIRLKVNDVSGEEIIKAGPFKDKFTPEELLDLNEDLSENDVWEKKMILTYEAIENEVKVSWDNVCAQSAKIYAKVGDGGMYYDYIKTVKDLSENWFTMKTKPCNLYFFEIDFFLSPDPDQKDYGALHTGINEFISPPEKETFATIRMDEGTKMLSWDFSQYRRFSNDPEITAICIQQKGLKYKITIATIDGQESNVLEEEDSPKVDEPYTFDVLKAINEKRISLKKCQHYELKMEVSYKTAMGKSKSRVFKQFFNISNLADSTDIYIRAPGAKPTLRLEGNNLQVEDNEDNNRCHKESYKIKCWDNAQNESSAEETIHPPTDISMAEGNFTVASNYTCKAKIQYNAQGGDQAPFESEWSGAFTFTVPTPPNAIEDLTSVIESKYPRQGANLVSPVLRFLLCQYFSKENPSHLSDDINIGEFNFIEGSEYSCRIKMEYKAKGGRQEILETEWSDPITIGAQGPN